MQQFACYDDYDDFTQCLEGTIERGYADKGAFIKTDSYGLVQRQNGFYLDSSEKSGKEDIARHACQIGDQI